MNHPSASNLSCVVVAIAAADIFAFASTDFTASGAASDSGDGGSGGCGDDDGGAASTSDSFNCNSNWVGGVGLAVGNKFGRTSWGFYQITFMFSL